MPLRILLSMLLAAAVAWGEEGPDPFAVQVVRIWAGRHKVDPRLAAEDRRECLGLLERKQVGEAAVPCGDYGMSLVERDPVEARRLLAIACEQRAGEPCLIGGYLDEIAGDLAGAERRFVTLCERGGAFEGPACGRAGRLIAARAGAEGRARLERGCASDGWSCYWLAEQLEREGDSLAAEQRYGEACKRGSREGCERRQERALARLAGECKAKRDAGVCIELAGRLLRAGRAAEAIPVASPLCAKELARPLRACIVLAAAELEGGRREAGRARYASFCQRWKYREACERLADLAENNGDSVGQTKWTERAEKARPGCDDAPADDLACELLRAGP